MSTIAYRDGVMAADSRAYAGGNVPLGRKTKIHYFDHTLVGISCLIPGVAETLCTLFSKGFRFTHRTLEFLGSPPTGDLGKFTVLIIDPRGRGYLMEDSLHVSGPIIAPYFAIGSGAAFALGALHSGASATGAIQVAIECDVWSDAPIDSLMHTGERVVLQ